METTKNILIEQLDLSDDLKRVLNYTGYKTVRDLTLSTKEEVLVLLYRFGDRYGHRLDNVEYEFKKLKTLLHRDFKVTFLNEYNNIGLTPELANTLISQSDLPEPVKKALGRLSIYTLGDLLTTNYEVLSNARGIGVTYLGAIKHYVHSFGYTVDEEPISRNYPLIVSNRKTEEIGAITPPEALVAQTRMENAEIRAQIEKKEVLVAEYDRLMEERRQLLEREKEIDQLIDSKIKEMKERISHAGK